jgi:hypothetical protein
MTRLNRDAVIAIVLLLICGVLFWATFDIREPEYGQLKPSTWPRVLYLIQSIMRGPAERDAYDDYDSGRQARPGVMGWLAHWRNPIWCFVLFFLYLVTLPYLGSLIGGLAFVFVLMGVLGGWQPKSLVVHAVVAVITVGGMWSIFTFGLGVILPPGEIFTVF